MIRKIAELGKKAALNTLLGLVPVLLGVGLLLVVGMLVIAELSDQSKSASASPTSYTNERVTAVTVGSFVSLDYSSANTMKLSCSNVVNATNASAGFTTLGTSYYTCGTSGFRVDTNYSTTSNSTVLVNYSASDRTYSYNASVTTQNATGNVSPWLPVFVIVLIGAALVALVRRFQV